MCLPRRAVDWRAGLMLAPYSHVMPDSARVEPEQIHPSGDERVLCLDCLVLRVLLPCAIVLVVTHWLVHNIPWAPELAAHDSPVRLYFDLASEANLWTWFNVAVLVTAAVMHLATGFFARASGGKPAGAWLVSGIVLVGLSIDDLTSLHERLQPLGVDLGGGAGLTYAAWLVPGLAFAAVVVGATSVLAVKLSARPRWYLVAGLGLFLGGAFVLEAVGNAVLESVGPSTRYAVLLIAEELAEAVGAILLLAAACAASRISFGNRSLTLSYQG